MGKNKDQADGVTGYKVAGWIADKAKDGGRVNRAAMDYVDRNYPTADDIDDYDQY